MFNENPFYTFDVVRGSAVVIAVACAAGDKVHLQLKYLKISSNAAMDFVAQTKIYLYISFIFYKYSDIWKLFILFYCLFFTVWVAGI